MSAKILLDCKALLQWDDWTAKAEALLERSGDSVHLTAVVARYINRMNLLYLWIFEEFEALHGVDMDEANRLVAEVNLTLTNGETDGRDRSEFYAKVEEQTARAEDRSALRIDQREHASDVRP